MHDAKRQNGSKLGQRPERGRGLFYHRDSGGKHEMTPSQYVLWARRRCDEEKLSFAGTPDQLEQMIRSGRSAVGDLFLDYDVQGNTLSRPGLDAMIAEARRDRSVSHVLIPRPDRLVRPDDVIDGIALETLFRRDIGVTLLFMNRVGPPLRKGEKLGIGELITSAVEYDRAGQDRRDLAQKIIDAQIALAKGGFSTGGRAPYGLRRCLVRSDGTRIRNLEDGEHVRTRGQHVVWVPGPEREFSTRLRILDLLLKMPATQVARKLTQEGIPSPDCNRYRTDSGVKHQTSGVWHSTTIVGIARHPINVALVSYGRRSMGDRLRFSPDGPRELTEADFREDDKPKVVQNEEDKIVKGQASFDPMIEPKQHQELIKVLNDRAGTQRGKPRSRGIAANPLGSRVFDMDCSWPMYRQPYNGSFRYACGLYYQSHGQQCHHNTLDGATSVRFLLSCVRQRLLRPDLLAKLEQRIQKIAEAELTSDRPARELAQARLEVGEVERQLTTVARNMALAETGEQRQAMARVFDELQARKTTLETGVVAAERAGGPTKDPKAEVAAAMGVAERLAKLSSDEENFAAIGELFRQVNARLFVRFREVPWGKRLLRKPDSGIVTFGTAEAPIDLYAGPTTRRMINAAINEEAAKGVLAAPASLDPKSPGKEGDSLGNVNRGDRI